MTEDPDVCVWCGKATATPNPHGGVFWMVSMATSPCEHETIDGRR